MSSSKSFLFSDDELKGAFDKFQLMVGKVSEASSAISDKTDFEAKMQALKDKQQKQKPGGQPLPSAFSGGKGKLVLPSSFDVSKIGFTPYYSVDNIRTAFELCKNAKDGKVVFNLPLLALFRGFDSLFSSLLWKEDGDWRRCHSVSEWLAMPAKNSRESARVVVSHGLNGYFFVDSSRMPNWEIGV